MCERYVALDVLDHVDAREKIIRCFQPGANSTEIEFIFTVIPAGEW